MHKIHGSFLRFALEYVLSCIQKTEKQLFLKMISTHEENKMMMSIADELRQEGRQEATKSTMEKIARNFLEDGLELSIVAKNTGLDLETIKKIKETLH